MISHFDGSNNIFVDCTNNISHFGCINSCGGGNATVFVFTKFISVEDPLYIF